MKYRKDIDGLRSLAVLPVVLYHAGIPGIGGGYIGVDIFFVISGFLITKIIADELESGSFSIVNFYERRARRILPALGAMVMASLIVGWFMLTPGELQDLGNSAFSTALFISNMYFAWTLDYFGTAAEFVPLLHTWSLAVEEQFYLAFPLVLAVIISFWNRKVALWALALAALVSLALAVIFLPERPAWVFFVIIFRAWELGIGAMLALLQPRHVSNSAIRETAGILALLAIIVPITLYSASTPFPGLAALPPVIGSAVLIWVGSAGGCAVTRILSVPVLVWIGLMSYSLYLWHWPIMAYTRIYTGQADLPFMIAAATIIASGVFGWLSYRFIETPFRKRPPHGFGRPAIFAMSGVLTLFIMGAGAALYVTDGAPGRLSAEAQRFYASSKDFNPRRRECFGTFPDAGLCQIGTSGPADGPHDFLFWGDSHANAMFGALDKAADMAGQSGLFAATSACPPLPELKRTPENRKCTRHNESIRNLLDTRNDMDLVIIAARWALSVEGTRYGFEPGTGVELAWNGPPELRPSADTNPALVEAGLRAAIQAIQDTGRQVVIIGQVPEVGWDVPVNLARADMLDKTAPRAPSRAEFDQRYKLSDEILQRVTRDLNVAYIRIDSAFCDDVSCDILDADGRPLYFDDDHVTHQGAIARITPLLQQIWATN